MFSVQCFVGDRYVNAGRGYILPGGKGGAWPLRGLTFDMSGGPRGAKRPLARPLDGGVRPHCPLPYN